MKYGLNEFSLMLHEFKEPMDAYTESLKQKYSLDWFRGAVSRAVEKTKFSWSNHLLLYIQHYNVLPSEYFLTTLQKTVNLCQKACRDEWTAALSKGIRNKHINNVLSRFGLIPALNNIVIGYASDEKPAECELNNHINQTVYLS